MDTYQLIDLLKKDKYSKKNFCGVIPLDGLPCKKIRKQCCFIVNTDVSSLPGTHWFAIFVPKKGPIEIFDSFGRKPNEELVKRFIKINNRRYIYNPKIIQSNKSINCGIYCVFYLYFRSRNFTLKKFIGFFTSNKNYNDRIIDLMYKKLIK